MPLTTTLLVSLVSTVTLLVSTCRVPCRSEIVAVTVPPLGVAVSVTEIAALMALPAETVKVWTPGTVTVGAVLTTRVWVMCWEVSACAPPMALVKLPATVMVSVGSLLEVAV